MTQDNMKKLGLFWDRPIVLNSRARRHYKEFSWDAYLKKNILYASNHPESTERCMLQSIMRLLEVRKQYPCFEIERDMYAVLVDIGIKYSENIATEETLKLIQPPYNSFIITFDSFAHCEDGTLAFQKNHIEVIIDPQGDVILHPLCCIINDKEADISYYYECIISKNFIEPNETITNTCFGKMRNLEYDLGSIHYACIFIYIGLCIALNQKSLYRIEEVPARKSIIHQKNKSYPYTENGYKKLVLSLQGQSHLQYIKDKVSGSKNKSRQHLRRGHFKQRKTGLFWWNPHIAGKESEYTLEKTYVVKA